MATHGKRRALGQHFLKDKALSQSIVEKAVSEAEARGCNAMLEIGPGKGALTIPLIERLERSTIRKLLICEKDRRIAEYWTAEQNKPSDLEIHVFESDFLELDEAKWLSSTPLGVVSNLPYSSGTAIVTRLARHFDKIPVMVLMFQAEVARRLYAQPNTKDIGSLSLWMQNHWDVEKFASVPPGAFSPPPEVDSEVVTVFARKNARIIMNASDADEHKWEGLLKAAFAHRRKMLRSSLCSQQKYKDAFSRSGIDGTKRAEALDWCEWEKLYRALFG